ncbi:helix-turn-helix domain-containing protein [Methylobacterium sp. Leaf85]|uniref:helix-turn-helix domain-containing protein n=1 Tax=Methylobacterium sp. Leaf85 TaxID=1736241 RepID=UPI0009EAE1AF
MSPNAWHHQDILAAVRKAGKSLRRLSEEAGFRPSTVQASLYRRHPRANQVIAEFLGVSRHEIWPHWYGKNDKPLSLPPRVNSRRRAA